jgi:large subunit ribosomal protein L3
VRDAVKKPLPKEAPKPGKFKAAANEKKPDAKPESAADAPATAEQTEAGA